MCMLHAPTLHLVDRAYIHISGYSKQKHFPIRKRKLILSLINPQPPFTLNVILESLKFYQVWILKIFINKKLVACNTMERMFWKELSKHCGRWDKSCFCSERLVGIDMLLLARSSCTLWMHARIVIQSKSRGEFVTFCFGYIISLIRSRNVL